MNSVLTNPAVNEKVDRIQVAIGAMPQADCPVVHRFTKGLYVRELFIPKGTLAVTKIHKTNHPFFVMSGVIVVWDEKKGLQTFCAPHIGITEVGTRRILFAKEDCVWATAHPTDLTNVEQIEAEIIEPRDLSQLELSEDAFHEMKLLMKETI